MSVGVWDPKHTPPELEQAVLSRFISLSDEQTLDKLSTVMSQDEQNRYAQLMYFAHTRWRSAISDLDNTQLWKLIQFLSVAEMQLPSWRADEQSPVIAIARELNERGAPLQREQLIWLRKHSDNRFLPHGRVL